MKAKVFVYGTLKKGGRNHHLLENASFVGEAVSLKKYILQGKKHPYPLATPYGYVQNRVSPECAGFLAGEIYEMDRKTLKLLDRLEEHPHYYIREKELFRLIPEGKSVKAFIYHCYHLDLLDDLLVPDGRKIIRW